MIEVFVIGDVYWRCSLSISGGLVWVISYVVLYG